MSVIYQKNTGRVHVAPKNTFPWHWNLSHHSLNFCLVYEKGLFWFINWTWKRLYCLINFSYKSFESSQWVWNINIADHLGPKYLKNALNLFSIYFRSITLTLPITKFLGRRDCNLFDLPTTSFIILQDILSYFYFQLFFASNNFS